MILKEIKSLKKGEYVHHINAKNRDGTPRRYKVMGKVIIDRPFQGNVHVPIKRGAYQHGTLSDINMHMFQLGYGSEIIK